MRELIRRESSFKDLESSTDVRSYSEVCFFEPMIVFDKPPEVLDGFIFITIT